MDTITGWLQQTNTTTQQPLHLCDVIEESSFSLIKSYTDALRSTSPKAGTNNVPVAPKMAKSIPQYTAGRSKDLERGKSKQRNQQKRLKSFNTDKIAADDLAFLESKNKQNSEPSLQTSTPRQKIIPCDKKNKNSGQGNNKKKASYNASKNSSNSSPLNLSASQKRAIEHLGLEPNSEYVKVVASAKLARPWAYKHIEVTDQIYMKLYFSSSMMAVRADNQSKTLSAV